MVLLGVVEHPVVSLGLPGSFQKCGFLLQEVLPTDSALTVTFLFFRKSREVTEFAAWKV